MRACTRNKHACCLRDPSPTKFSEDLSFFHLVKKNESEDAEVMNSELGQPFVNDY